MKKTQGKMVETEKLSKLFKELKEAKRKKWKAGSELIRAGDRVRKIESKIDRILK